MLMNYLHSNNSVHWFLHCLIKNALRLTSLYIYNVMFTTHFIIRDYRLNLNNENKTNGLTRNKNKTKIIIQNQITEKSMNISV